MVTIGSLGRCGGGRSVFRRKTSARKAPQRHDLDELWKEHMSNAKIFITAQDRQRLEECLSRLQGENGAKDQKHIQQLEAELARAQIIDCPRSVPADVITMSSTVRLKDLDTGKELEYTLVYPGYADADQNRVSVLAPVGAAMLGCRIGDILEWEGPKGPRRLRAEALAYQPEAAGDYTR